MSREYALLKDHVILFQTERFDSEAVTETVPLSGGAVLLIEGEDPDREELSCRLRQYRSHIPHALIPGKESGICSYRLQQ